MDDTTPAQHARLTRLLAFLERDPDNLSLLLDALSLAISLRDLDSGRHLIQYLHTQQINAPQAFALAAHLMLQAGEYAKAGEYGDRAIEGGIVDPAVLFNTAFGHFYNGDFAVASELLASLTAGTACPADTLLMHARALHQLEEERTEEAEALVVRALVQEPENPQARGLLALLLYENGKNAQALNAAHESLAAAPDQLDALLACASVQFELNNIAASRKAWLHTVNCHPQCGRAWAGLAELEFNELEFEAAEEHLRIAVEFMPDHIGTWHLLAWIYILQGHSSKARQALDSSYKLDRNFAETHGGLAIVEVMEGFKERAQTSIRRALKLNPDCLSVQYANALQLQAAGEPEKAKQLLNEVLDQRRPDSVESGRTLLESWLRDHQNQRPPAHRAQH